MKLAENIMHFGRLLRAAGLPIGPGHIADALRAAAAIDVSNRAQLYWALHAVFVHREDQRELFHQAFGMFWRDPAGLNELLGMLLPKMSRPDLEPPKKAFRRLSDVLNHIKQPPRPKPEAPPELELDMKMTWSDVDVLRQKDFAEMTAAEIRRAREEIQQMRLLRQPFPTRRWKPDPTGRRLDPRRTMKGALRTGGVPVRLRHKSHRERPPPLVAICDVSGSMESYSRILIHFLHVLCNDRDRVSCFVFGTRLTNITRQLRHRDVDLALARVGERVTDWSGGTKIGETLKNFNQGWSRRVLGQGAVVLLITDGIDRDLGEGLSFEMRRLRASCRALIWLNPLLRYRAFQPRAAGVRAMLPHVDEMRPVHNLESLADLRDALSLPVGRTAPGRTTRSSSTSP